MCVALLAPVTNPDYYESLFYVDQQLVKVWRAHRFSLRDKFIDAIDVFSLADAAVGDVLYLITILFYY